MEILLSARRHGISDEEIFHALSHPLAVEDVGEDPDRWLIIGPDAAGNLLELVVLLTEEKELLVIHAMVMRAQFRRLLP